MDKLKKLAKWAGAGLGVLVALVVGLGIVASCSWNARLDERYETADHDFEIPELTDENRAEAERLYLARGCGDCHGADGAGRNMVDAPPFLMNPPNITGVMRAMSANDIHKLVRRGIRPNGAPVFFMPAQDFARMPDRELGLITAYVRSLPQVDAQHEQSELRMPGRILAFFGVLDIGLLPAELIDQDAPFDPAGPDEMGEYIVTGCRGCHGEHLSGGPIPAAPPELGVPRNLTPHETGLAGWTLDQFVTVMRTGRTPDGEQLDPDQMPYRIYAHLSDDELAQIFTYLQGLEPIAEGNR